MKKLIAWAIANKAVRRSIVQWDERNKKYPSCVDAPSKHSSPLATGKGLRGVSCIGHFSPLAPQTRTRCPRNPPPPPNGFRFFASRRSRLVRGRPTRVHARVRPAEDDLPDFAIEGIGRRRQQRTAPYSEVAAGRPDRSAISLLRSSRDPRRRGTTRSFTNTLPVDKRRVES